VRVAHCTLTRALEIETRSFQMQINLSVANKSFRNRRPQVAHCTLTRPFRPLSPRPPPVTRMLAGGWRRRRRGRRPRAICAAPRKCRRTVQRAAHPAAPDRLSQTRSEEGERNVRCSTDGRRRHNGDVIEIAEDKLLLRATCSSPVLLHPRDSKADGCISNRSVPKNSGPTLVNDSDYTEPRRFTSAVPIKG
jgi:hypothetical protein